MPTKHAPLGPLCGWQWAACAHRCGWPVGLSMQGKPALIPHGTTVSVPTQRPKQFCSYMGPREFFLGNPKGQNCHGPQMGHMGLMGFIWVFTHRKPIWSTQGMKYPKGQNCSRPCVLPGAHRINVNLPFPTQPHVWQTWAWYWHRVHSGSSAGEYHALSCMCFCSSLNRRRRF